jgi:N-glycosylase/DNA lyase
MELVLWLGYSIYFYDEEDGRDYVGNFIDSLANQDGRIALEIVNLLFRRLSNGEGVPVEWTKGIRPKVKPLSNRDIFEYRRRSSKLRKEIRVYFGVHRSSKTIVFVEASFKTSNAEQKRHIELAERRFRTYIKKHR